MKLTNQTLRQIIKEELSAIMEDQAYGFDPVEDREIVTAARTASSIEDFIEDMRIMQDDPEWGEYDPEYVKAAYEWGKSQSKQ